MEESIELYDKQKYLIRGVANSTRVMDSAELQELVKVDIDLIELWQSFEKDAMLGIDRINDGSISAIKVPTIFGYPNIIYYYNGIILFRALKNTVYNI